jgi:large subunit ribosomal protein L10
MAVSRQKKEESLKTLQGALKDAKVVVFVNFHGLSVSAASELRKSLRAIGATYTVAKKTLIKKALENFGFSGELPNLEGEIAMAVSKEDALAPAKVIKDFGKKNKTMQISGGVFENKFVGTEVVVMLANIPPREVLLAQFVNIINSPIQGFVVALSEIAKKKS